MKYKYKIIGGVTRLPQNVKLGCYHRLSSKKQAENSSIWSASRMAEELALQEGWELVANCSHEEFTDIGISGSDPVRPQFNALLKSGANVIVVNDFDRFSRRQEVTIALNAKLQWSNITLIEVKEAEAFDSRQRLFDDFKKTFEKLAIEYAIKQGYTKQ